MIEISHGGIRKGWNAVRPSSDIEKQVTASAILALCKAKSGDRRYKERSRTVMEKIIALYPDLEISDDGSVMADGATVSLITDGVKLDLEVTTNGQC